MATDIAHPVGFLAGSVVYALLLMMVLQGSRSTSLSGDLEGRAWYERMRLPLYMAMLGLTWNLASLGVLMAVEIRGMAKPPFLSFLAITALGSLPAVALHSVWQTTAVESRRPIGILTIVGYVLCAAAMIWNGVAMVSGEPLPDPGAWTLLTIGFLALFLGLLVATKRALWGHGGLIIVFLAVCSVLALPFSHHPDDSLPWWLDFLGHHASLPVAVAVLYRDYQFAFVDRFLKRAVSFLLLVGMSFGLYINAVLSWLGPGAGSPVPPIISGLIIALWVVTALSYSWLHRQVTWVFDALILRRPDYGEQQHHLAQRMNEHDTLEGVLGELCQGLQKALRSRDVRWERPAGTPVLPSLSDPHTQTARSTGRVWSGEAAALVQTGDGGLIMVVPTIEEPRCILTIAPRANGHRFLSEEWLLVEAAALIAARRIDVLRTSHERCEIALREQEMQKLTTEAELRALRAQVNPHFLFNALNTIGYLIDTAPARAAGTLRDLTRLLRSILRRMEANFTTLGEEIELIRSYLDIEKARFEERLTVRIEVPDELTGVHVPALVLQPLVENAVKHGIQPALRGGAIQIAARRVWDLRRHGGAESGAELLCIEISDTGVGVTADALRDGRQEGIGLANVEHRLRCLYGERASLHVVSEPGVGTTVTVHLPAEEPATPTAVPVAVVASGGK